MVSGFKNAPVAQSQRDFAAKINAPVAQLDRAPAYEAGGYKFDSCPVHNYFQ